MKITVQLEPSSEYQNTLHLIFSILSQIMEMVITYHDHVTWDGISKMSHYVIGEEHGIRPKDSISYLYHIFPYKSISLSLYGTVSCIQYASVLDGNKLHGVYVCVY